MYSYWEIKTWFSAIDFVIIGSGIVGLSCAIELREQYPKAKIIVLERGSLPSGASTKNAGFACFGSASELIADREKHHDDKVLKLVEMRIKGLEILRHRLGDKGIGYRQYGGYELFPNEHTSLHNKTIDELENLNQFLKPTLKYPVFRLCKNDMGFGNIKDDLIYNPLEGQIDTGVMMKNLISLAISRDIHILNGFNVTSLTSTSDGITVISNHDTPLQTRKVIVANNGFASDLLELEVKPARAQVLITSPIASLPFRGTFHMDRGFYYFRNIDNSVLFGGGRQLDIDGETTTELGTSQLIQNDLEEKLKTIILPGVDFNIEHRWSGIMGVGPEHLPIVKEVDENIYCAVRLSGMGIALGSYIARELVHTIIKNGG